MTSERVTLKRVSTLSGLMSDPEMGDIVGEIQSTVNDFSNTKESTCAYQTGIKTCTNIKERILVILDTTLNVN